MKTFKWLSVAVLVLGLCSSQAQAQDLFHGITFLKSASTPIVVGGPYFSAYRIANNVDEAEDTLHVHSLIDTVKADGGDVVSGNLLSLLTWDLDNGSALAIYDDKGDGDPTNDEIILPFGAIAQSAPYSFYTVDGDDYLNKNPLPDQAILIWNDQCDGASDNCNDEDQQASASGQARISTPNPDLCIDKTVDFDRDGVFTDLETNAPGEDADWAIVVTNCGDTTITDIYVSDDNLGTDWYGPFDLESGESEVIPVYTTNPTTSLVNTACAVGVDVLGETVGPVCDPAEVIVECPQPCINITKTVDCSVSKVGDTVTYTITVENCGDSSLTDVEVTDPQLGVGPLNFPSTLTSGQIVSVDFEYTVLPGDDSGEPGATLVNQASVSAIDGCDGETPISDDSEEVSVLLVHPCLDVVVECISDGPVVPGGEATFSVTLTNCGDVDLSVDVTTDLGICETGAPLILTAAGGTANCQSSVLVPLDFVGTEICLEVTAAWDIADDLDGCLPNEGTVVETGCCALTGDTYCSFTQGFWGNAGGTKCGGQTTSELITAALAASPGGVITIGVPPRSISFNSVQCILDSLPAGGTPAVLPVGPWNCGNLAKSGLYKNKKKTELNNVLIGQTLALQLNLLVADGCLGDDSGNLATWVLPAEFCVVPYDDPEACPKQYTIPSSLVGKTVQQLLDAANAALGGTGSISDAYAGATAINEGFDECATVVDCGLEIEICENGCDDDYDGLVDELDDCVYLD